MKIASIKILAVILFSAIAIVPLCAQTNAPAENGTNPPVAVADSAQATNPIAVTGNNHEKNPSAGIKVAGLEIHGSGKTDMEDIVIPIVSMLIIFGSGVTIVAIAINFNHRRNKMLHETLRAMIDKGMPITPELMAGLKTKETKNQPRNDLRNGLILTGVGIGVVMIFGKIGCIALFLGVAFLIASLVEKRNKNGKQPPKP